MLLFLKGFPYNLILKNPDKNHVSKYFMEKTGKKIYYGSIKCSFTFIISFVLHPCYFTFAASAMNWFPLLLPLRFL